MRALRITLLSLVAAIAASGCVIEVVEFDPSAGGTATLDGQWTIDGATPDAANCSGAGIASVELRLYEAGGPSDFFYGRFDCADGYFDAITDTTLPLLIADRYDYRWFALDASGTEIGRSDLLTVDLTFVDHATLATVDWTTSITPVFEPLGFDVSLDGAWQIDGKDPTAADCTNAGIDTVQLVLISMDGTLEVADPSLAFPCEQGMFDSRPDPILAAGSYQTAWRALAVDGSVLAESDPLALDVTLVSHATLATVDFVGLVPVFNPAGTDLTLDGAWTIDDKVPTTGDCSTAGITEVQVVVYSADGSQEWTDPSLTFACDAQLFDTRPTGVLAAGEYGIVYRALMADGSIFAETSAFLVSMPSPGHVTLPMALFTTF